MRQTATAEVRVEDGKATSSRAGRRAIRRFGGEQRRLRSNFVAARLPETVNHVYGSRIRGMSVKGRFGKPHTPFSGSRGSRASIALFNATQAVADSEFSLN